MTKQNIAATIIKFLTTPILNTILASAILLLATTSNSYAIDGANFILVTKEAGMSQYIDKTSLIRIGNNVNYKLILNFETQFGAAASNVIEMSSDCNKKTFFTKNTYSYTKMFGQGMLLSITNASALGGSVGEWGEIQAPKIACNLSQRR
jgi:hypothetical protein